MMQCIFSPQPALGYICSKCEHSSARAWYRLFGAAQCDFRRTLMPCDAAPVYLP